MDTDKLFKKLINDEELKNISILDITKVAIAVLEAINSGDCLFKIEEV